MVIHVFLLDWNNQAFVLACIVGADMRDHTHISINSMNAWLLQCQIRVCADHVTQQKLECDDLLICCISKYLIPKIFCRGVKNMLPKMLNREEWLEFGVQNSSHSNILVKHMLRIFGMSKGDGPHLLAY